MSVSAGKQALPSGTGPWWLHSVGNLLNVSTGKPRLFQPYGSFPDAGLSCGSWPLADRTPYSVSKRCLTASGWWHWHAAFSTSRSDHSPDARYRPIPGIDIDGMFLHSFRMSRTGTIDESTAGWLFFRWDSYRIIHCYPSDGFFSGRYVVWV